MASVVRCRRGWRQRVAATRLGRRIATKVFQPRGVEAGEVFLDQRRVFILPTRAGLLLSLMLVALLLGSINYSLSLGFALTFLVAGVAWVGMLATFRNLAHLHLRPLRVEPVFAGDAAEYRLVVRNASTLDRYAIELSVDGQTRAIACDPAAGARGRRDDSRCRRRGAVASRSRGSRSRRASRSGCGARGATGRRRSGAGLSAARGAAACRCRSRRGDGREHPAQRVPRQRGLRRTARLRRR